MATIPPTDPASDQERAYADLKKRQSDLSASQQMFALSGIGFEFVLEVVLFSAGGWWLDRHFDTSPVFTLVGVALGFGVGLFRLVRVGRRIMK